MAAHLWDPTRHPRDERGRFAHSWKAPWRDEAPNVAALAEAFARIGAMSGVKAPVYELLLKRGQSFKWAKRPKGLRVGTPQECYANAGALAIRFPDEYEYVEGFATPIGAGGLPIPVQHAWLTPAKGKPGYGEVAYDVTWTGGRIAPFAGKLEADEAVKNGEYVGVIIPHELLAATLVRQGYYGVLENPAIYEALLNNNPPTPGQLAGLE